MSEFRTRTTGKGKGKKYPVTSVRHSAFDDEGRFILPKDRPEVQKQVKQRELEREKKLKKEREERPKTKIHYPNNYQVTVRPTLATEKDIEEDMRNDGASESDINNAWYDVMEGSVEVFYVNAKSQQHAERKVREEMKKQPMSSYRNSKEYRLNTRTYDKDVDNIQMLRNDFKKRDIIHKMW